MSFTIYLTNEDIAECKKFLPVLGKIIYGANQSRHEEELYRKLDKSLSEFTYKSAFLKIQKELKKMPNKFKDIFNEKWLNDHTRIKPNGLYEIRCSIDKVPLSGAGKTPDIAAENFIKCIARSGSPKKQQKKIQPVYFNDFAENWYEVVKKPTVKPNTYKSYISLFNSRIKPFFKGKDIRHITAMQIQPLFTKLGKEKLRKVTKDIDLLLTQIFKSAIGERLIAVNPMDEVRVIRFQTQKGTALLIDEESAFLEAILLSPYRISFLLLLFCGMRRGELRSARIENGFIIVIDSKLRIGQLPTERKIPITPMFERYLGNISKSEFKAAISVTPDVLTRAFKKLCPSHHLHELRHTFITRAQECGVPREVVSVWAGHAADKTMTSTVYTHFSDEFMKNEGKKVDYYNRLKP